MRPTKALEDMKNFYRWMSVRHSIYLRKELGDPKPWTEDRIFQQWKFTNVFRQLDNGTIWLNKMLKNCRDDVLWNIIWYRLFNRWEHAKHFENPPENPRELMNYLRWINAKGEKVFTNAHMTASRKGEEKIDTYADAVYEAWRAKDELLQHGQSMEKMFKALLGLYLVGPFVAYEIVCDLRFTGLIKPVDRITWANIGPGAKRGLARLQMPITIESMRYLWEHTLENCPILKPHFIGEYPPFELREIEHSLCEFDKYERIRLKQGRPRMRYAGI